MNRKDIINLVNIMLLVFGLCFMFVPDTREITLLGTGFFVASALNLCFNNLMKD